MGNVFSSGDGGSGPEGGDKRDRDDKGKAADDVQSSKKQKVDWGDRGEQERADASKKLASMGFELNAHTEKLLRKHDNNLDTVVAELLSMQERRKGQDEAVIEEEELSSDGMQASGDEDEDLRRALALSAAQVERDVLVYASPIVACVGAASAERQKTVNMSGAKIDETEKKLLGLHSELKLPATRRTQLLVEINPCKAAPLDCNMHARMQSGFPVSAIPEAKRLPSECDTKEQCDGQGGLGWKEEQAPASDWRQPQKGAAGQATAAEPEVDDVESAGGAEQTVETESDGNVDPMTRAGEPQDAFFARELGDEHEMRQHHMNRLFAAGCAQERERVLKEGEERHAPANVVHAWTSVAVVGNIKGSATGGGEHDVEVGVAGFGGESGAGVAAACDSARVMTCGSGKCQQHQDAAAYVPTFAQQDLYTNRQGQQTPQHPQQLQQQVADALPGYWAAVQQVQASQGPQQQNAQCTAQHPRQSFYDKGPDCMSESSRLFVAGTSHLWKVTAGPSPACDHARLCTAPEACRAPFQTQLCRTTRQHHVPCVENAKKLYAQQQRTQQQLTQTQQSDEQQAYAQQQVHAQQGQHQRSWSQVQAQTSAPTPTHRYNYQTQQCEAAGVDPLLRHSALQQQTQQYALEELAQNEEREERQRFFDQLNSFNQQYDVTIERAPIMGGHKLDLHALSTIVLDNQGFENVQETKKWRELALHLGVPKTCTSATAQLRSNYLKYLYAYECWRLHGEQLTKQELRDRQRSLANKSESRALGLTDTASMSAGRTGGGGGAAPGSPGDPSTGFKKATVTPPLNASSPQGADDASELEIDAYISVVLSKNKKLLIEMLLHEKRHNVLEIFHKIERTHSDWVAVEEALTALDKLKRNATDTTPEANTHEGKKTSRGRASQTTAEGRAPGKEEDEENGGDRGGRGENASVGRGGGSDGGRSDGGAGRRGQDGMCGNVGAGGGGDTGDGQDMGGTVLSDDGVDNLERVVEEESEDMEELTESGWGASAQTPICERSPAVSSPNSLPRVQPASTGVQHPLHVPIGPEAGGAPDGRLTYVTPAGQVGGRGPPERTGGDVCGAGYAGGGGPADGVMAARPQAMRVGQFSSGHPTVPGSSLGVAAGGGGLGRGSVPAGAGGPGTGRGWAWGYGSIAGREPANQMEMDASGEKDEKEGGGEDSACESCKTVQEALEKAREKARNTNQVAASAVLEDDSAEPGEGDLEEAEVEDAAEAFQKDACCNSDASGSNGSNIAPSNRGGGVAAGGTGGLDSGSARGASADQWFRGQWGADAGHPSFEVQCAADRAAGLPTAKALQPALASLVTGVVPAPLPDTGMGSVGALEALLRERTLETCGTEALLQLAPISQTPGVMSTAPSTQKPKGPTTFEVGETVEQNKAYEDQLPRQGLRLRMESGAKTLHDIAMACQLVAISSASAASIRSNKRQGGEQAQGSRVTGAGCAGAAAAAAEAGGGGRFWRPPVLGVWAKKGAAAPAKEASLGLQLCACKSGKLFSECHQPTAKNRKFHSKRNVPLAALLTNPPLYERRDEAEGEKEEDWPFETGLIMQLKAICGEPTLWNTKRKVIDQIKASVMWDRWLTAFGAAQAEKKLVSFIYRLKTKHLGGRRKYRARGAEVDALHEDADLAAGAKQKGAIKRPGQDTTHAVPLQARRDRSDDDERDSDVEAHRQLVVANAGVHAAYPLLQPAQASKNPSSQIFKHMPVETVMSRDHVAQERGAKRRENPKRKLNTIFEQALASMLEQNISFPFQRAVREGDFPSCTLYLEYRKVVSNPIDLSIIRDRCYGLAQSFSRSGLLRSKTLYDSQQEFVADIALMVSNCRAYNEHRDPQLVLDAMALEKICHSKLEEHAGAIAEAEERIRHANELGQITNTLMAAKEFKAFVEPVNISGYASVVKRPMALMTMLDKARTFGYSSRRGWLDDLALLRDNCYLYCSTRFPHLPPISDLLLARGKALAARMQTTLRPPEDERLVGREIWEENEQHENEEQHNDCEERCADALPLASVPARCVKRSTAQNQTKAQLCSIQVLLEAGLVQAGLKVLSVTRNGRTLFGDLLSDSTIHYSADNRPLCEGLTFNSPSGFGNYCCRLLDSKFGHGNGFTHVFYSSDGKSWQPLDHYRKQFAIRQVAEVPQSVRSAAKGFAKLPSVVTWLPTPCKLRVLGMDGLASASASACKTTGKGRRRAGGCLSSNDTLKGSKRQKIHPEPNGAVRFQMQRRCWCHRRPCRCFSGELPRRPPQKRKRESEDVPSVIATIAAESVFLDWSESEGAYIVVDGAGFRRRFIELMQKRRGWGSREMEGMRHHFCLVRGLTWAASGSVFKPKAGHASRVTQDKEEMLYLVEAVIGERRVQVQGESMAQVLVMWRNYGLSAATWEPLLNIPSEFVDKFKKGELPDPAIFDSDNEVPTETCERKEQGEKQFTPSANPQRRHVDLEEPVPGAQMNRNGDGRERHSADPRGLDRHRNNQKMLKIKNKAGRHGSSGGIVGVGRRVGMDKTRRSGDRRGPIPLGLDKAEAREQRLRHLARYNRFQVAETLNVRKQADASYGEAGSVTAAKEDGSDTHMGEPVTDADDASEGPESLGPCLNGRWSDGAGARSAASESARDIHAGGKEGVCREDPSATLAEKAPEDLEGLPPLKELRLDVSEREAYLQKGLIKWFDEHCGFFRGTVRAYDAESDVYKIAYATDDEEDMSYEEVKSLVLRGTGGGSTEVVSSYGSWWVAAENDTPRRIVAELAKRGPGDGPGRGALQVEQIVELNRRQYPALLVTSKLRKNTLVFLGAGGGRAVDVDAGSGGVAQDAAGAVSESLDACKQLPPAPMSPSRDTGVGREGDGADDICEGSNVRVCSPNRSLCWGSRPGGRSAACVVEPEPEMQGFHVVVPENVKPGQQFCARIGTDGPLMSVFCPENCGPGTTLQVRLPKAALPRPKNPGAVRNAHQASSGGGGGYSCSRSPLTMRKPLAPSFKGAGTGNGMGAMCSAFPFQRRLLEEASGASVGATVAEAQARTRVSVAFNGGEDEVVRRGGEDVVEGQGGVDELVRCSRPRDAPKGREGGGGDVSRVLGADVGIDNECVVCMDVEKSHAFVPCGHMCVCKGCAGKIMGANKECPFCCSVATAVMRVFT